MMRMAPALLLALSGSPLAAEGARETWDCRVTQVCDRTGGCVAAEEAVLFEVAPVETDAEGGGPVTVARDGGAAVIGARRTVLAAITWSETADDEQALMLTGETSALWSRLDLTTGTAAVKFLTCEVVR
jgi:hypothetical protein